MDIISSGKKSYFNSHMMMGSQIDTNSLKSKAKHDYQFNDEGELTEMMVM